MPFRRNWLTDRLPATWRPPVGTARGEILARPKQTRHSVGLLNGATASPAALRQCAGAACRIVRDRSFSISIRHITQELAVGMTLATFLLFNKEGPDHVLGNDRRVLESRRKKTGRDAQTSRRFFRLQHARRRLCRSRHS